MSGTYSVTMGDRGRLVIPAELRDDLGLATGARLMLLPTPEGFLVTTRDRVLAQLRRDLAGPSLVDELISDRRAEVERERAEEQAR